MREPAVAGAFYPEDAEELRALVRSCFAPPLGPPSMPPPTQPRQGRLRGIIVPHAGLAFSGAIAAHAFAALAEDGLPATVVLVGPNHAGDGGLGALSAQPWRTPLGVLQPDVDLVQALASTGLLHVDEVAHAEEHSLEVQLPFLQMLAEALAETQGREAPRIVPLVMGLQDEVTSAEVGDALARALRGKDAVLVASSDLMHAGPDYLTPVPRSIDVGHFVRSQDEHALRAIAAMDPDGLLDQVRLHDVSMCGAGPVAAVLHAVKARGCKKARLLAHATSFDVHPARSAVGYAAFVLS